MAQPRSCGMGTISHLCTFCRGQKTEAQITHQRRRLVHLDIHLAINQLPNAGTSQASQDPPRSPCGQEYRHRPHSGSLLSLNQTKHHWAGQRCRHGFWTQQRVSLVVGSLVVFHLPISALTRLMCPTMSWSAPNPPRRWSRTCFVGTSKPSMARKISLPSGKCCDQRKRDMFGC